MIKPPDISESTWQVLSAAHRGDLQRLQRLIRKHPKLVSEDYAYWQPIHFAVRGGHADAVSFLLDSGADPLAHIWHYGYHNPLEIAEDRGYADIASLLKDTLDRRHQIQPDRGTRLCDAVRSGDVEAIRTALELDPDLVDVAEPTREDAGSNRPLHLAVAAGRQDIAELLLEHGANIDALRGDGFKPVHVALWEDSWWRRRDNWAMLDWLDARGADCSICVAAARNDPDAVRTLLRGDRSLANFEDTCRKRALSCAAERGHVAVVKTLLDHGADPNLPEANAPRGHALFAAAHGGHAEVVELLLEAGADPHADFHASGIAADAALGGNDDPSQVNERLAQAFYRHGAAASIGGVLYRGRIDIMAHMIAVKPSLAQEYLDMAIHQGQTDIVYMMLRKGATIEPRPFAPWQTPLMQSVGHGRRPLAELLLERGADINWPNWFGHTPLHYAVMREQLDMVTFLLERGADPDCRDWDFESTPLGWAAWLGNVPLTKELLRHGAQLTLPDDQVWNTPLARARKQGHEEVIRVLLDHDRGIGGQIPPYQGRTK